MTDIDEVNDVIQETDEETYALDFEFTEEKEYKTVQKYELVTILSYLIGVRNEILDHMCSDEYVELLNSLRENKNARILRYLCKARTGLLRNYKKTDNENFRIAISVGKKIGNAVERNKVKRYIRNVTTEHKQTIDSNYDYFVIARKGVKELDYVSFKEKLEQLYKKMDIIPK